MQYWESELKEVNVNLSQVYCDSCFLYNSVIVVMK